MKIQDFDETKELLKASRDKVTHLSTGIALVRNNKILIVRRVPHDFLGGWYELPGGGVDDGESIIEGAERETKEELGLTISEIIDIHFAFDYKMDSKPKARQYNLVIKTKPGPVVLNPDEHDDFQWIPADQIDSLHVTGPVKKSLLKIFTDII